MFIEHPVFAKPQDPDTRLWRYLDFARFVSMLETSSLWFSNVTQFEDDFEGSYPPRQISVADSAFLDEMRRLDQPDAEHLLQVKRQSEETWRKFTLVNCWHASSHESVAMWKTYMQGHGIAVVSDYDKLCKSFRTDIQVQVGEVKYLDYGREIIPADNMLWPYVHKRWAFEYEREVRAVIVDFPPGVPVEGADPSLPAKPGINVRVELAELVSEVVIQPNAPSWYVETVAAVSRRYGFDFEVRPSELAHTVQADPHV